MSKWLYALGGCIVGFLAKKKIDEHMNPDPFRRWPSQLKPDDNDSNDAPPADDADSLDDPPSSS